MNKLLKKMKKTKPVRDPKDRSHWSTTGTITMPLDMKMTVQSFITKTTCALERGNNLPPGSIHITRDLDNASQLHFTMSDPRNLNTPVLYPGPSHPGGSIADPIVIGTYQDGVDAAFTIPGHQFLISGMTGSGKSMGGAVSCLAEIITRTDVEVWAVDVTKGSQTLGPLPPAIDRFASQSDDALKLLQDGFDSIRERTDFLTDHGYENWKPGCGIPYRIVWIEEMPEVLGIKGAKELIVSAAKAARSAGITYVLSMQRATFEEIPTVVRDQCSKICFGMSSAKSASYGLSDTQIDSEQCHPEHWGSRQPGMCFIDSPSIPFARVTMPIRTWFWPDHQSIREHVSRYLGGE